MVSNSPVTFQRTLSVMAVFLAVCVAQALTQLPSLEPSKGHIALSLSCAGRDAVRVTIANDGNVATGLLIGMVAGPRGYWASKMMFEGIGQWNTADRTMDWLRHLEYFAGSKLRACLATDSSEG